MKTQKLIMPNHPTDRLLKNTEYWTPPVPTLKVDHYTPTSKLRIACILEDRLHSGLRFESELLLLTPANWKQLLRYAKPDFLLIESTRTSSTGHWRMSQYPTSPGWNDLLELINSAKAQSIPTVFWNTKGVEYHDHYKHIAQHFDAVFCADPRESDRLRAKGLNAEILLPCVQPTLYNPFRLYEQYDAFKLGILYDGWADLDRMTDELKLLKKVIPYGLSIIESRYHIFRSRMDHLPDYKEWILGCISPQSRITALKYAQAYITFSHSLSTRTTQQWMVLEAAASRLPVIHSGGFKTRDLRNNFVLSRSEENELLLELVRFQEDEWYRKRRAHLCWRKAIEEHTFSHRLRDICSSISIDHTWKEFPKASIITPTYRKDMIDRCLKNFGRQTYPEKELLIVYNGDDFDTYQSLYRDKFREDVKLLNVPSELFAGGCLNQGILQSEGEYCFRMDDDDYYGPNYISDMIMQARSIRADLFGKPPVPLYSENSDEVFVRNKFSPLCIVSSLALASGRLWFGGNSISGKKEFFLKNGYHDTSYGAADTSFMVSLPVGDEYICAFTDDLNLMAERREDPSSHTFRADLEKFSFTEVLTDKSDLVV